MEIVAYLRALSQHLTGLTEKITEVSSHDRRQLCTESNRGPRKRMRASDGNRNRGRPAHCSAL